MNTLDWRVRPIQLWPGDRTRCPRPSRFRASWSNTSDLLARELEFLRARQIVLELAVEEHEIRQDGWIRASARPQYPGIIISFGSKHGPLRYPCDRFDRWGDNVRAVALGLQALRAVDRYGVTRIGEQYRGWRALPSPNAEITSTEAAATMIRACAGPEWNGAPWDAIVNNPDRLKKVCRAAQKRTHPDHGGDEAEFAQLTEAIALVKGSQP